MSSLFFNRRRVAVALVTLVILAGLAVGLYLWQHHKSAELPVPGSALYEEYTRAFEIGTAAVDVEIFSNLAQENLTLAIEKIPQEPAAWANRGLLYLRNNELDKAASDLRKAHELAPDSYEIEGLLGVLADRRGDVDSAVAHLRKAVERNPRDLRTQYALAGLIDKSATADSDAEYQKLIDNILQVQPNNLKMLLERAQLACRRRDPIALKDTLARLQRLSAVWSPPTQKQLQLAEKLSEGPFTGDLTFALSVLNNLSMAERGYQRGSRAVNAGHNKVGEALQQFLRLAPLRTSPDPPDLGLTFVPEAFKNLADDVARDRWDVAVPIWLTGDGLPTLFVANAKCVRRADGTGAAFPFPSGPGQQPPTADGILAIDWDNDTRTDLVLVGAGGLRFWKQEQDGTFKDVSEKTGLGAAILQGDYLAAWAADIDMDGDLDIILAPRRGSPLVLRNNRDGTFKLQLPFAGVNGVRAFVWADFDNDGAPDAAMIDSQGLLHVFANERGGFFRGREMPQDLGRFLALAAADVNDDGVFDLVGLRADGVLLRLSDDDKGRGWQSAEIASGAALPANLEPGAARLLAADLDNNGMIDFVAAGPGGAKVWLGEGPDKFTLLPMQISESSYAAEDMTGNGRLDLIAISDAGQPVRLANRGTLDYHWLAVRPQANPNEKGGDDRINSHGIGGEIEMREGTMVQKQSIAKPRVHFGLGKRTADFLRIIWPNGTAQVEMAQDAAGAALTIPAANKMVIALQRLSGSCPFLFTWDGNRFQFVADFMWSTPLGLYINGQDTSGFMQMQEWVKIRGDQLVPKDGYYDIRVAATLWEADYFDHLGLTAVDHPADTEVYVDERFALRPTEPEMFLTGPPRPVAQAWDDRGTDVSDLVRAIDGRYLDTFGRGRFQGITRDHWVELDLGEDAPREGPLWLLAHGWIHPTDSSINVAVNQGRHDPPCPLILEIPDGKGGWKASGPPLGFPAGKNKTMLIRLDGIAGKGVTRHFRLRTNMEIYWDALQYAVGLDAKGLRPQRLNPDVAELRYRGILEITQANPSSPELPEYDKVTRNQNWRDLIGYYTRFGDVRELLAGVDDRYAILNAGDEIVMHFRVPDGPPLGWKRDFIWVSEGWTKDGNLNTRFSKTVLPLPAHDQKSYERPPGLLQNDPVYRRFWADWRTYHTRYITPDKFEQGLRPARQVQP